MSKRDLHREGDRGEGADDEVARDDIEHAVVVALVYFGMMAEHLCGFHAVALSQTPPDPHVAYTVTFSNLRRGEIELICRIERIRLRQAGSRRFIGKKIG